MNSLELHAFSSEMFHLMSGGMEKDAAFKDKAKKFVAGLGLMGATAGGVGTTAHSVGEMSKAYHSIPQMQGGGHVGLPMQPPASLGQVTIGRLSVPGIKGVKGQAFPATTGGLALARHGATHPELELGSQATHGLFSSQYGEPVVATSAYKGLTNNESAQKALATNVASDVAHLNRSPLTKSLEEAIDSSKGALIPTWKRTTPPPQTYLTRNPGYTQPGYNADWFK